MALKWQYDSYNYLTKSVVLTYPRAEVVAKERFAETPGRHGGYTQGGLLSARRFTVGGQLIAAVGDDLEALWDAFMAAHVPGVPKKFYPGRDDRFISAEVVGVKDVNSDQFPTSVQWELNFLASDPTYYADTATSDTITTGGTVTNLGTVETWPSVAVVLTALGTAATLTLTNSTTGKSLVIAMPGSLTTLTIDMAAQKITNTGGTDVTDLLTSGEFWSVAPGANTIVRTFTGGATASSIVSTHRDRWL